VLVGTPWDARTYDQSSQPQQAWASEVLARGRLGDRAEVWCQDVLDLELDTPVDVVVSTAALHWVTDHDRLWTRLAQALAPGGVLEVQCGGQGNIDRVRKVIDEVARDCAPQLVGWSPWVFAAPQATEHRLKEAGFTAIRCWLEERPTHPEDVAAFVPTSILAAHLARLAEEQREPFAAAVVAGVRLPLDYVRLNISAVRGRPWRMDTVFSGRAPGTDVWQTSRRARPGRVVVLAG
jgi:trans-aconitate 2-methyltransferase